MTALPILVLSLEGKAMKIILSRKGFDSENGGYPSPILPDGKMISLPIPLKDSIKYSDLKNGESTYYDLMLSLKLNGGHLRDLDSETRCHLDPDIYKGTYGREPGWKPCFGQIDQAQIHLENQKVDKNDLFLFFGWFRKTRDHNGKPKFYPKENDMHAIFGYFQIGEIEKVDQKFPVSDWMAYHPHASGERLNKATNTIYVARDTLEWNDALPGAARFLFNDRLVLTKKGLSKSKWNLPDSLKEAEISYHTKDSWRGDYFQSAYKGQEFVIKDNEKVEEWARSLIEDSKIDS